jgi:hypothetical protein
MNLERRHLTTYQGLFVTRSDIHARQQNDGSYFLKKESIIDYLLINHLAGRVTIGLYALDRASFAKWAALDADSANGLERLQQAHQQLATRDLPSHLEQSRRGGHLWLFLEAPIPGADVRRLVQAAGVDLQDLELYPKQDRLDQRRQVGSLIRGPLGIHRKSGHRYPFLDPVSLRRVSPTVLGTLDYLKEAGKVSVSQAARMLNQDPKPSPEMVETRARATASGLSPIELVKAKLGDARTFLGHYLELDQAGKAHCPFHPPDKHKSFAINASTGRWTCFHEYDEVGTHYLSGDNLDFYVRLTGLSYKEAIRRLLW